MGRFEDEVVKATSRTMDMLLYGMSIDTLRAMHCDALYARDHCPPGFQRDDHRYTVGYVGEDHWYTAWDVLVWHIADVIEARND